MEIVGGFMLSNMMRKPMLLEKEFLVNTSTYNHQQSEPSVAALKNGGFIITWQSYIATLVYGWFWGLWSKIHK